MPKPRRPLALPGRVFRAGDVLRDGLLTRDELRSAAWRRLYRGVYADVDLPQSYGLRVRGARLLMPPAAVFSGRTAAYLLGAAELVDVAAPIEVSMPAGAQFGPVAGLRIRRVAMSEADRTQVRGFRCTSGLRTALDIARSEPLLDAVSALDVLLSRAVVGISELREAGKRLSGGRGAAVARRAVELADPRAESQPESRLRVLLALAGLPAVPQHTVRDQRGTFVARVDLAYPEQKIAIEYDGYWHSERGQFTRDRQRLNRLVAAGWTVLHVTAIDMRDPAAIVARVRQLLAARESGEVGV